MFNRLEKTKQASRYRRNHANGAGLGATNRTGLSATSSDSMDDGQDKPGVHLDQHDIDAAEDYQFDGADDIECVLSGSSRVMAIDQSEESLAEDIQEQSSQVVASDGTDCEIELPLLVRALQNELLAMKLEMKAMQKETKEEFEARQQEMKTEADKMKEEMKLLLAERGRPESSALSKHKNANTDTELVLLPEDLFTLMMVAKIFENWLPTLSFLFFCSLLFVQWSLSFLIILDSGIFGNEIGSGEYAISTSADSLWGLPTGVPAHVQVAQWIVMLLSPLAQTDIFEAIRTLTLLRYRNQDEWKRFVPPSTIGTHRACPCCSSVTPDKALWLSRIFLPNLLKLIGGLLALFVTWLVIMQSTSIVDLLKDFTALYILAELDDIFFFVADRGFFGRRLALQTEAAKGLELQHDHEKLKGLFRLRVCSLMIVWGAMIVGAGKVISLRKGGVILKSKYPQCSAGTPARVGNGICNNKVPYNTEVCGYDGGDCLGYNRDYSECTVDDSFFLGNNRCNYGSYNTPECEFDGGDCLEFNANCKASNFSYIHNNLCDGGNYNTPECEFDGGDCLEFNANYPNCKVDDPYRIGDGDCDHGDYNTPECEFDGGDCLELNANCTASISDIGNNRCDGGNYNTPECEFDGGDCLEFNAKYPDCKVDKPYLIGDGFCNKYNVPAYNTPECGFDGGDCLDFNKYRDCKVEYYDQIGDGECNAGNYNTPECEFDGGDCLEFNAKYPDCKVDDPYLIGNRLCNKHNYPAFNTPECGFDGGDCMDFIKYPDCTAQYPYLMGNGECNGYDYNTAECGFDGGDCLEFNAKYPDCKVDNPYLIGDGFCNKDNFGSYNTPECGFDGGDCLDFNKYRDCKVEDYNQIGDGYCNGGDYNTPECAFDGGDCLEFNARYPDCKVDTPWYLFDGRCDGGDYNTPECGFDGGDCL